MIMMILLGSVDLRTQCTPYKTHSAILAFFDIYINIKMKSNDKCDSALYIVIIYGPVIE